MLVIMLCSDDVSAISCVHTSRVLLMLKVFTMPQCSEHLLPLGWVVWPSGPHMCPQ